MDDGISCCHSAPTSHLSGDVGGGAPERVRVASSLLAVAYEVTRVRLELRLLHGVQFAVASKLFDLLIVPLTFLTTTLLLNHPITTSSA